MALLRITEELRFALTEDAGSGAGLGIDDHRIAERLAELLGLGCSLWDSPLAKELLVRLVPTLEDVVAGKAPRDLFALGTSLVSQHTKDFSREQLYSILKTFGWEDERVVGEPKFSGLAKLMRRVVAEKLATSLAEMCERWRSAGVLGTTVQRKREVGPRVRRDLTMTRLYQPPGRT